MVFNKCCILYQVHSYTYVSPKSRSSSPGPSKDSAPSCSSPISSEKLQTLIYELLKARPGGVWSLRLGGELKKFHKMSVEAPKDIGIAAMSLPFVEKDE